MFDALFSISLIGTCVQAIKDAMRPTITAEQWGNKELIYEDVMNGVSVQQQIKNAQNGKYLVTEKYPEPHRNKYGQVVIENTLLWKEDLHKYNASQVKKWVEQGKYNLTPEELEKEHERIEAYYERLYNK